MRSWALGWVGLLAACRPGSTAELEPWAQAPAQSDDLPLAFSVHQVPNVLAARGRVVLGETPGEVAIAYGPVGSPLDQQSPSHQASAGETFDLPVLGLTPGEWQLAPVFDGEVGAPWTVTTALPDEAIPTEVVVAPVADALSPVVCGAVRNPSAYRCIDPSGTPVAYVPFLAEPMFVRSLADGTWLVHPREPGPLLRIDRMGQLLDVWRLDDLEGFRFVHDRFDSHDIVEVRDGPWTGALAVLTVTRDAGLDAAGIVVFDPDDGQVLWDWTAHGVLGDGRSIDPAALPYDRESTEPDHPEDWQHANAVAHARTDGVDRFWLSLRHQDWVIRVDTDSDQVGLRIGAGGDVRLLARENSTEDAPLREWMYHQHAPEWTPRPDGTLEMLVVDNGNTRPVEDPYSRLVRFVLSADRATAWVDWSYGGPPLADDHFLLPTAGDIDAAGEEGVRFTHHDDDAGWVSEIAWSGELTWQWTLPGHGELYRTEAYPTLYGPSTEDPERPPPLRAR